MDYEVGGAFDTPANTENAGVADCPSGTVAISGGVITEDVNEEVNSVAPTTPTGGSAPTEVVGVVDNFNSTDEPDNYVVAVCTAAHTG